jgi:NAD(P)H-flavin reductase
MVVRQLDPKWVNPDGSIKEDVTDEIIRRNAGVLIKFGSTNSINAVIAWLEELKYSMEVYSASFRTKSDY